ncbi:MAG: hypothetical protein GY951_04620 [Psychromonas sp.]|nr:hypothetical protein [Alteromonadales bacterium]MCP5077323.1 hypothetical protein [Psychromonas sp.]
MKTKLWLLLATGVVFSSVAVAEDKERSYIKCYLQLDDKSEIVHQFVNSGEGDNKQFIESLAQRGIFMADGVTEKKIQSVYECVELKSNFKNKKAVAVEKNTPF